ncbi:Origin recognition complex subunit 2 [Blyttiomyces sp. JEL0837]|nr:Origin recognition complex subunit 2 [Blyttiomyces sp. JEL0837]
MRTGEFTQWQIELSQGFNIILYGYGSKLRLITKFKEMCCTAQPVLTVHGYMPTANIARDVLGKIAMGISGKEASSGATSTTTKFSLTNPSAVIDEIAAYFNNPNRNFDHIYLLIHNIDGAAIRDEKSQGLLSGLIAACPSGSIRLVASVDHINATFMWDRATVDRYKWVWKDATTFDDYDVETNYEGIVLVESGHGLDANGAVHVLRSLNANARRLFRILAENQIQGEKTAGGGGSGSGGGRGRKGKKTPTKKKGRGRKGGRGADSEEDDDEEQDYVEDDGERDGDASRSSTMAGSHEGLSHNVLYTLCVDNFIVSNSDTFKAQLAEFKDHKIILTKKNSAGDVMLYIPFDEPTLEKLLAEI